MDCLNPNGIQFLALKKRLWKFLNSNRGETRFGRACSSVMHAVEMESSKLFILDRSVGWKSVKFRRETAKRKTQE